MREICKSGSMRGCRKRAVTYRACVLLYRVPEFSDAPFLFACLIMSHPRASQIVAGVRYCRL
jgi:hypothetical protein